MILFFILLLVKMRDSTSTHILLKDFALNDTISTKSLNDLFKVSVLAGTQDLKLEMEVFLYSNYSILSTCPSNGLTYNCSLDPNCTIISNTTIYQEFIFDSFEAYEVQMPLFLSDKDWGSESADILLTNSCTGLFSKSNTSGAIGLGTEGIANDLFRQYTNFSVQLDENSDGLIIFGISDDFENYQQAAFISQDVSPNWEIYVSSVYAGQSFDQNHYIVFDVTFEYIGIPKDLYLNITYWLSNNSVTCNTQSANLPTQCQFSGITSLLPSIYFYTSSISPIEIPPSIYLKSNGDGYNLTFVGTDPIDPNFITVNPNYENYIIFGVSFLEKFIPIFDFSNPRYPTIVIFNSSYSVFNNPSNIVFIIIMGVLAVVCAFSIYKAYTKKDKLYADLRNSLMGESISYFDTPGGDNSQFDARNSKVN